MPIKRTVALRRWTPLAASLAMFALLCATIAYWALQWLAPAESIAPAGSIADQRDFADLAAAAPLFGLPIDGRAAAPDVALSNIRVLGVAASAVRGSAVLSVDGKPPKAFMVGEAVTGDATLIEVRSDAAVIERNGTRFELVAPQRPSVAILSGGPVGPDAATAATTPPVPAVSPRSVPLQPVAPQSVVPQSVAPQSVPPQSVPPQPAAFPAAAPTQPAPAPPHVQLDGQAATQAGTPGVAQPAPMPGTQPDAPGSPPPEASGGAAPASRP